MNSLHSAAKTLIVLAAAITAPATAMEESTMDPIGLGQAPHQFIIDGKQLTYEDSGGEGPVVICIPGLGDTRAQFRFLAPLLVEHGYRVIAVDPRGQGDSSVNWASYSADAIAQDIVALLKELNRDAFLIGNSAGAAVAVGAAAELPQGVKGIVLIGPFVRDIPMSWWQTAMVKIGFAGPWAAAVWGKYYRSLYPGSPPADIDDYIAQLQKNLKEPGRMEALKAMMFASKAAIEKRIPAVMAPTLVVMGDRDPDFANPQEEAERVAGRLNGTVAMMANAGHYPHVEVPRETLSALTAFLENIE